MNYVTFMETVVLFMHVLCCMCCVSSIFNFSLIQFDPSILLRDSVLLYTKSFLPFLLLWISFSNNILFAIVAIYCSWAFAIMYMFILVQPLIKSTVCGYTYSQPCLRFLCVIYTAMALFAMRCLQMSSSLRWTDCVENSSVGEVKHMVLLHMWMLSDDCCLLAVLGHRLSGLSLPFDISYWAEELCTLCTVAHYD